MKILIRVGAFPNYLARTAVVAAAICTLSATAISAPQENLERSQKTPSELLTGQFEENRGQWASEALFKSEQSGYTCWIKRDGFSFVLTRVRQKPGKAKRDLSERTPLNFRDYITETNQVELNLLGANQKPEAYGLSKTGGVVNYLNAKVPIQKVQCFGQAFVNGVYEGINLRSYMRKGQLSYDFIVQPGADPSQIRMSIGGAGTPKLNSAGDFVVESPLGSIVQSKPFAFQIVGARIRSVDAEFKLTGRQLEIKTGQFDSRFPLIIDPVVKGTYLGSDKGVTTSGFEQILDGVTVDGGFAVTGQTTTSNFPNASNSLFGGVDAFLARYYSNGQFTVSYIGGAGDDIGRGVGYFFSGNRVFISGTSSSATILGSGKTTANTDLFVSDGVVCNRFGDFGDFIPGQSEWVDSATSVYGGMIVGNANSSDLQANGVQSLIPGGTGGGRDAFLLSVNMSLNAVNKKFIGGTADEVVSGIANRNEGVFVVGTVRYSGTQDTSTASPPAFPTTANVLPNGRLLRNDDAFGVSFDAYNMNLVFSALFGGSGNDEGLVADIDSGGERYLIGRSGSGDFLTTSGAYDSNLSGDCFLMKIAYFGKLARFVTGLGYQGNVAPTSLKVGSQGVVYIGGTVGWYPSGNGTRTVPGSVPVTSSNALDGSYLGGDEFADSNGDPIDNATYPSTTDGYVQVLDSSTMTLYYGDYVGGGGNESIVASGLTPNGTAFFFGNTEPVYTGGGAGPKTPIGIGSYYQPGFIGISKSAADAASMDGFVFDLDGRIPLMTSFTVADSTIHGGFGASTTLTVNLQNPAPLGGVPVTLFITKTNDSFVTFSNSSNVYTLNAVVPAGATSLTVPIYSRPLTAGIASEIVTATVRNRTLSTTFLVDRWATRLDPIDNQGYAGETVTFKFVIKESPVQPVVLPLSVTHPAQFVNLPSTVVVPPGTNAVTFSVQIAPLTQNYSGTITVKEGTTNFSTTYSLLRSSLKSMAFVPNQLGVGAAGQLTISINGISATDLTINLARSAGITGVLINGNALPTTVTLPAGSTSVTAAVTAPPTLGTETVTATLTGGGTASSTLNVVNIGLSEIILTPSDTIGSGEVATGQVVLINPAPAGGFPITLSQTNPSAGSLSTTSVVVPEGQTVSPSFTYRANVVSPDAVTAISASRTSYAGISKSLTVKAMTLTMTATPSSVKGGYGNFDVTATLNYPAPSGGLNVYFYSSYNLAAAPVTGRITITGGNSTATNTYVTNKIPVDANVVLTGAIGGVATVGTTTVSVKAIDMTGMHIEPDHKVGGNRAWGYVDFEDSIGVNGAVVTLSASPTGFVTIPSQISLPVGEVMGVFPIDTIQVGTQQDVLITASYNGTTKSAVLTILPSSLSAELGMNGTAYYLRHPLFGDYYAKSGGLDPLLKLWK